MVAGIGYFREAVLAARFGLSTVMDAYFGAVFIPTIVYMVLVAGMLSPVFIPILLQENLQGNRDDLSETFSVITNFVLLLLVAIVCLAVVTAPKWLALLFPGFTKTTAGMTVNIIYIVFPSILFVALAGILASVLNAFHKFALAAIAPALSSLAVIIAALFAGGSRAIYIVSFATAAGFLMQMTLLIPAVGALGIRYRLTLKLRHPAIRQILRLGGPLFLYLVIANASAFIERNLASRLSLGAVSTITYAMRLFTVPSNFLAAPLAIVAYPQFAREAVIEGRGDLCNQLSRMFRLVVFIFLPVTMWIIVNALPVTRLLYERGQFTLEDSLVTSRVFMFYAMGVLPNAIAVILLRCFYAIQDTLTPLWVESLDLLFYGVSVLFMTRHFGIVGLAATRGLQFYCMATILTFVLWRKQKLLRLDFQVIQFVLLTVAASVAMSLASWGSLHFLQGAFDSGRTLVRLIVISTVLILSATIYLTAARLLKITEATRVLRAAVDLVRICSPLAQREVAMVK